nr:hypothetical protein [Salmonid herpesvirus 1]
MTNGSYLSMCPSGDFLALHHLAKLSSASSCLERRRDTPSPAEVGTSRALYATLKAAFAKQDKEAKEAPPKKRSRPSVSTSSGPSGETGETSESGAPPRVDLVTSPGTALQAPQLKAALAVTSATLAKMSAGGGGAKKPRVRTPEQIERANKQKRDARARKKAEAMGVPFEEATPSTSSGGGGGRKRKAAEPKKVKSPSLVPAHVTEEEEAAREEEETREAAQQMMAMAQEELLNTPAYSPPITRGKVLNVPTPDTLPKNKRKPRKQKKPLPVEVTPSESQTPTPPPASPTGMPSSLWQGDVSCDVQSVTLGGAAMDGSEDYHDNIVIPDDALE